MKPRVLLSPVLGVLCFISALAYAGPTNPATPAAKTAKAPPASQVTTNASPATNFIPKSVFLVPADPTGGKDPFFPKSPYPYGTSLVVGKTNKVATVPELSLTGISGSAESPLVIINDRTFGKGDSGEIVFAGKRVQVVCLDIDLAARTAIVQVNGQRQTLRLKQKIK